MRRPLCYVSMAFVVTVLIYLNLCAEPEGVLPTSGIWQGQVYHKEYRAGQLILYLNHIQPQLEEEHQNNQQENKIQALEESTITGILCYVKAGQEPKLYSTIQIEGEAQAFQTARNPGGFDQKSYYQIQRLDFKLVNATILRESQSYSRYHETLYQFRRRLEHIFDTTLSEKEASIMKAMLLGNKQELDQDSKQLFQQSGISHILAISGLHISIIGLGLYQLLRKQKVPLVIAALLAVAVMIAYGDMVGMSSSSYRAIFMFAMKMGATLVKRTYDMLTALALSALLLLIEQPLYLEHAGFLLSFGAILGVGYVLDAIKTDTIRRPGKKQNKKKNRKYDVIAQGIKGLEGTLAIFLVHAPILLSFYYEFPIYSFLLNLIVIPAMSILLLLGLVCLAGGLLPTLLLGQGVASLAAFGCHVLLRLFEELCSLSLRLPGATWIVGKPARWRIAVFYALVLLLCVLQELINRKGRKLCLPFPMKLIIILTATSLLTQKTYGKLQITVLDVGQGDGIWIETDRGQHYLIDGGSTSERKLYQYTLLPFLKYTGTDTVDAIFLTHLDRDHTSGILELLENDAGIRIKTVLLSKAVIQDEAYEELMEICKKQEIPCQFLEAGDVLTSGSLNIEVLHPLGDYQTQSRNAYSLVMKLEYGSFHALFTGDVEADGEAMAMQRLDSDWTCHFYKAAHHGSNTANTEGLLQTLQPKIAAISCAENNSYGHPHQEVLQRLAQVGSQTLITRDTGAIMLQIKDEQLQIRTYQ